MQHFDEEALVVAMALVPGLYSRNRFFQFYADPVVPRARRRANLLRAVAQQIAGARGEPDSVTIDESAVDARGALLRVAIRSISFERRLRLSRLELACLRCLCKQTNVAALRPRDADRALVDGALARLAGLAPIEGDQEAGG